MILDHSLTPCTKISSEWIKDLNVRLDTVKLIKESTVRTFSDINHRNIFFDPSPRIMEIKIIGTYLNSKLSHSKGNDKQNEKATLRLGENICK